MALTAGGVVVSLISTVIFIFVNALLLMASAAIFKLKDKSYKSALWVTGILGGINFVVAIIVGLLPVLAGVISGILTLLVVGILVAMYLIKIKYDLDWGKAALVWLVYTVFALVAGFIIGLILAAIFIAVGLGAGLAA